MEQKIESFVDMLLDSTFAEFHTEILIVNILLGLLFVILAINMSKRKPSTGKRFLARILFVVGIACVAIGVIQFIL